MWLMILWKAHLDRAIAVLFWTDYIQGFHHNGCIGVIANLCFFHRRDWFLYRICYHSNGLYCSCAQETCISALREPYLPRCWAHHIGSLCVSDVRDPLWLTHIRHRRWINSMKECCQPQTRSKESKAYASDTSYQINPLHLIQLPSLILWEGLLLASTVFSKPTFYFYKQVLEKKRGTTVSS